MDIKISAWPLNKYNEEEMDHSSTIVEAQLLFFKVPQKEWFPFDNEEERAQLHECVNTIKESIQML
jgi:hypothetical protein